MPKTLRIRGVPDAVHRKLSQRAANAGMTLSDFLLHALERRAALPPRDEGRGATDTPAPAARHEPPSQDRTP